MFRKSRKEQTPSNDGESSYFYQGDKEFVTISRGVGLNTQYRPGDKIVSVLYDPDVLIRLEADANKQSNLARLAMLFAEESYYDSPRSVVIDL